MYIQGIILKIVLQEIPYLSQWESALGFLPSVTQKHDPLSKLPCQLRNPRGKNSIKKQLVQWSKCENKFTFKISLIKEEPEASPRKVSFQGFLQLTRAWYQKEVTSILTLSHFGVMISLPFNQNLNSKLNVTKSSSSCLPYFGFKTHVL